MVAKRSERDYCSNLSAYTQRMAEESHAAVFVAATSAEADRVAQVLDDAGIEYSERLDAALEDTSSRICYLGTVFEVDRELADRCRKLLKDEGLEHGLI